MNRSAAPPASKIDAGGSSYDGAGAPAGAGDTGFVIAPEDLVNAEIKAAALVPADVGEEAPVDPTPTTVVRARRATKSSTATANATAKKEAKSKATAKATPKTEPKTAKSADDHDHDEPAPKAKSQPEPAPKSSGQTTPASKPSSGKSEAETLACIREVESDGNYRAVSPSGQYRGAYQMDNEFWTKYGGDPSLTGRHEEASSTQQDAVAAKGYRDRGLAPWPSAVEVCG